MRFLGLRAYLQLLQFEPCLARGDFAALYEKVRRARLALKRKSSQEQVCLAVDTACIWYGKRVLCLQRSAATVCLMRRNGIAAKLVVGAQSLPFKAHAWVEVGGLVVNDKPYMPEIYAVLDRC